MSCGHAVTPMSLTNWCRRLLEEGKSKFVCGQPNCNKEWPYVEVRKMALLTPKEREYFESTMAQNAARDYFNSKTCPGCKFSVTRKNESNLSVRCQICTERKGKPYEFCWQCLKEWKGPQPRSDRCDNDGCINEALKTLRTCPEIVFESVKNVRGCPSIRACPTCGSLLEHTSKYLNQQRDAAEYFEKILTLCSEEASQVFQGKLTNSTVCKECEDTIDEESEFLSLPLALVKSHKKYYSVVDGLEEFFKESHLDEDNQLYCDKCSQKSDASTLMLQVEVSLTTEESCMTPIGTQLIVWRTIMMRKES
ncbi:hypothetical protein FQA47_019878 [Oryzias melastigma]|uniref:RING-type domain-containing protein n=1 Tax=Oryzias melastigma TaxID=30732 RepID=A0A834F4H8_ORYME|nr:hypothetical protein FQA47_019878 [Oryzias melastigma]